MTKEEAMEIQRYGFDLYWNSGNYEAKSVPEDEGEFARFEDHARIVAELTDPCGGCGLPGHKTNAATGDPGQTRYCLTCALQAKLDALLSRTIAQPVPLLGKVR